MKDAYEVIFDETAGDEFEESSEEQWQARINAPIIGFKKVGESKNDGKRIVDFKQKIKNRKRRKQTNKQNKINKQR